jgi:hypothetical protein
VIQISFLTSFPYNVRINPGISSGLEAGSNARLTQCSTGHYSKCNVLTKSGYFSFCYFIPIIYEDSSNTKFSAILRSKYMPGNMFNDKGKLNIPEIIHEEKNTIKAEVVINAVYCPEGHNLISVDHEVSGFPGILVRYRGRKSGDGLVSLSAVFGDTSYEVAEGNVDPDEALDLSCPICGTELDVLASCPCRSDAVTVMGYLYPKKDPHQAIAFCNVLSCPNSAVIRSGEAIRMLSDSRP